MRMKKSISIRYILFLAFLTVVMAAAVYLWHNNREAAREVRAFRASGGEIVVIFDRQIEEEGLKKLTGSLSEPVTVIRHLEDYALIKVQEEHYLQVLNELRDNPRVKAVQANDKITTLKTTGKDTYADSQWALNNTGKYYTYYNAVREELKSTADIDMNIPEAWGYMKAMELGRQEVVIAIIDTGVDYKHPDLAGHIWVNEGEIPGDGLDNDDNGYVDDIYGWDFYNDDDTVCHYKYNEKQKLYVADPKDNDDHGTHVAGIISAAADNGIGVAGAASNINVKLMILKINGGTDGTGSISSAIEAVKYATRMGADICNLSWGTSRYTVALKEVMSESDMLFVAAAGNSGDNNNDKPVYPANLGLPNLISVTFVDAYGEMTSVSNYGKGVVDIAAPGNDILSTIVGTYSTFSGSSMAAPQVTAVAALLYSIDDYSYPSNIKDILLTHTKPLPQLSEKLTYPGMPDAFQCISAAAMELLKDTEPPVIELETIYDKEKLRIPVKVRDNGGAEIRVVKWLSGEKPITAFGRGTAGTTVTGNQVEMDRAGIYTFYAADFAGNETISIYRVREDITPPKITLSYTVSASYKTRTVSAKVSDTQSNVKRVKYMPGIKSIADFRPAGAGTEITLKDGKAAFKVKKDGIYSIYALDNRGNEVVRQINVKTIKANRLRLSLDAKTLTVGEEYALKTFLQPANTTDKVTFTSSDERLAQVSSKGSIKALGAGTVYITARTYSGVTAICEITVTKKR